MVVPAVNGVVKVGVTSVRSCQINVASDLSGGGPTPPVRVIVARGPNSHRRASSSSGRRGPLLRHITGNADSEQKLRVSNVVPGIPTSNRHSHSQHGRCCPTGPTTDNTRHLLTSPQLVEYAVSLIQ